jgi:uncharacterized protein YcaQ
MADKKKEVRRVRTEIIVYAQSGNHAIVFSEGKIRRYVYLKEAEANDLAEAFNIKIQIR